MSLSKAAVPVENPTATVLKVQKFHVNERDELISMDEAKHLYHVKDYICSVSVTAYVSSFFDKFESATVLDRCAQRENCSIAYIDSMWKNKSFMGSRVHAYIEMFIIIFHSSTGEFRAPSIEYNEDYSWIVAKNPREIEELKKCSLEKEFVTVVKEFINYYVDHFPNYDLLGAEYMIYGILLENNEKRLICGTIDAIYWSNREKKEVVIVDWKTNMRVLTWERKQTAKSSLFCGNSKSDIDKYFCQLHAYRHIIEFYYGLTVTNLILVHLRKGQRVLYNRDPRESTCGCNVKFENLCRDMSYEPESTPIKRCKIETNNLDDVVVVV